jgi:hypothetical protein
MTKNWLYPLSRSSGRWFVDDDGNELPDTCFGCFLHLMSSKRTDSKWYVTRHANDMHKDDQVWAYYGQSDGDRGVVGVARVLRVEEFDDGTPAIVMKWQKQLTSRLIDWPFPAAEVRLYVPYPRNAVMALDPHPQLVAALKHHLDKLA